MSGPETSGYRPPATPLEPLRSWHASPTKGNILMALGCGGFLIVSFLTAAWAFSAAWEDSETFELANSAENYVPQYAGYLFTAEWLGVEQPDPELYGWEEVPQVDGAFARYFYEDREQLLFTALWVQSDGPAGTGSFAEFVTQFAQNEDPNISYRSSEERFDCGEESALGRIYEADEAVGQYFVARRGRVVFYVETMWSRLTPEEVERLRAEYCESIAPIAD